MDHQHKRIDIPTIADSTDDLPNYSTIHASGADVRAKLEIPLTLASGTSTLIPTGLVFSIPPGYEVQVRPRSGLALKHGITVLNTPGTIDADYRGEVGVILMNHSTSDFIIEPGMRIAQLVVAPVVQANFIHAKELATTAREDGGFGHTGLY